MNFIEFCVLLKERYVGKKSIEERKAIARQEYETYEVIRWMLVAGILLRQVIKERRDDTYREFK